MRVSAILAKLLTAGAVLHKIGSGSEITVSGWVHELSLWQGNQRQIISFLAFNPGVSRGQLLFEKLQGTMSTDSFQTILLTQDC